MGYRNLQQCIQDLELHGQLVRLEDPVDAHLEAAEIHRRVYARGGPAILFANVRDCPFPMVSNLFGDVERARFLFRDALDRVRRLIELKVDPQEFWRRPGRYLGAPWTALAMLPKSVRTGPVVAHQISVDHLPQLVSWPDDGGPFITLPQVYTEHPDHPGRSGANLGMYRVQLAGNQYAANREIGLHYQIHRGIGVHHEAALRRGEPLKVNIFAGGTPAMTLAAVMPLPEGMSELGFAGALAGHRIPMISQRDGLPIYAEADFCLSGTIDPERRLPEGPFGDHLGYYSLAHDFPVLRVERVWRRNDAIWPFTVVGRPPQEDTAFGELIHEISGPVIPTVIPGVKAVNAVDAAGVHPLMLALGSERYWPDQPNERPMELLTQANAILGHGQMSLAKYLWIANAGDDRDLDVRDEPRFFQHMLERVDWSRDLHFQTQTTIDTLDYSGGRLNEGSKVVVAAVGPRRRTLPGELPSGIQLPEGFRDPHVVFPGVLAVSAPPATDAERYPADLRRFTEQVDRNGPLRTFPLIVLVDDAEFTARTFANFCWVVFTRSDPAADIGGVDAQIRQKHWGCEGPLVIDARTKPHHAPPLVEDPEVARRVDALATRGGPLAPYL